MKIRGLTFDLWDTLVHDDSDEVRRNVQGLRSKYEERRHLLWEHLNTESPLEKETVWTAYDAVDAAFNKVWKQHHITWPVEERLDVLLKALGRKRPESWKRLVRETATMEVEVPPDLIEGCGEVLANLSKHFQLAVVSDAIVTPGAELRRLLENHGIALHFSAFAFSDEVGHSKPHPDMFETALDQLGLAPEEAIHIGDRDHNDIKGAQAMGMKAILFTATRDADASTTSAEAQCASFSELPGVISRLMDS
ncbi:MAG: HAD family hydrolase [Verrucomicrobiota bacterium]